MSVADLKACTGPCYRCRDSGLQGRRNVDEHENGQVVFLRRLCHPDSSPRETVALKCCRSQRIVSAQRHSICNPPEMQNIETFIIIIKVELMRTAICVVGCIMQPVHLDKVAQRRPQPSGQWVMKIRPKRYPHTSRVKGPETIEQVEEQGANHVSHGL